MNKKTLFLLFFAVICYILPQNVHGADAPKITARKVLFDFMKSKEETAALIKQWHSIEWTKGKANAPVFEPHPEGGVRLELQMQNLETHEYEAPNVVFDFPTQQDWSEYNFLVLRILNPTEETNSLRIDLHSGEKYAVQVCPVPPGDWYELRIPMSRYINFAKSPLDVTKITGITLMRRDLTRMIPFRLASISLENVEPPVQVTEIPGLQAWFFPGNESISKPGFKAINATDPMWSQGKVTIGQDKEFAATGWDVLWKGHAYGMESAVLNLPIPEKGRYQAAIFLRSRSRYLTDTFFKVGNSRLYRHIIGSAYAEMRLVNIDAEAGTIPLYIKQGRKEAPWSISAVLLYPQEKAAEILEKFVYPCLDDMTVAVRDDRLLIADNTIMPPAEICGYDFYKDAFTSELTTLGNELIFAITQKAFAPQAVITLENLRDEKGKEIDKNAVVLKTVMEYTAASGSGYKRIPRFCKMMLEREVPLRKGFPNWFLIEGTGTPGIICGDVVLTDGSSVSRRPFRLRARGKLESSPDVNYFLWYYSSNGGQEHEEFKAMRDYGFKALELPIMNGKITRNPDDTFSYNMAPIKDYMRRYVKRSGLKGTIPIYLYNPIRTVNGMLENKTFIAEGPNLEKSIAAIVELVRATEELRKAEGWPEFVYYPFDEFGNVNLVKAYHKAIRALGVPVFTTSVGTYGGAELPSVDDEIDVYCYPNCPPKNHEAVKAAIERKGGRFWGYSVDPGNALQARFNWGLKVWHLGMTGYGGWHFGGGAFPSTLIRGEYRYGFCFYGPGRIMTTPPLFAVAQAMEDYNALKALEAASPDSTLVKRFHEAAEKHLFCTPAELSDWYANEGEKMFAELKK